MDKKTNPAALLGKKGGAVRSEAKAAAARKNGKKGGRPPKSRAIRQEGEGRERES